VNRRDALTTLAGLAIAGAAPARAQGNVVPVVGVLYAASSEEWPNRLAALRMGLAEQGYVDGRNVTVEVHQREGQGDSMHEAANDFVRRRVAVIVATGGPQSVLAAKAATATLPIVVTFGGDPVKAGLVASLNRPGGNITGVAILTVELAAKLLDVFREFLPRADVVSLLVNPDNPIAPAYAKTAQEAASGIGLRLPVLKAATAEELDAAFAAQADLHAGGMIIAADPFFEIRRPQLIGLAQRYRTPTFYFVREFVTRGGLASYGSNFNDAVRVAGTYAGRILRGAKPSDLPVVEAAKFELVINARTAAALGLAIPQSLRLRADEIIQR
jgi:putative ABC transport system substrate-binding protein